MSFGSNMWYEGTTSGQTCHNRMHQRENKHWISHFHKQHSNLKTVGEECCAGKASSSPGDATSVRTKNEQARRMQKECSRCGWCTCVSFSEGQGVEAGRQPIWAALGRRGAISAVCQTTIFSERAMNDDNNTEPNYWWRCTDAGRSAQRSRRQSLQKIVCTDFTKQKNDKGEANERGKWFRIVCEHWQRLGRRLKNR